MIYWYRSLKTSIRWPSPETFEPHVPPQQKTIEAQTTTSRRVARDHEGTRIDQQCFPDLLKAPIYEKTCSMMKPWLRAAKISTKNTLHIPSKLTVMIGDCTTSCSKLQFDKNWISFNWKSNSKTVDCQGAWDQEGHRAESQLWHPSEQWWARLESWKIMITSCRCGKIWKSWKVKNNNFARRHRLQLMSFLEKYISSKVVVKCGKVARKKEPKQSGCFQKVHFGTFVVQ